MPQKQDDFIVDDFIADDFVPEDPNAGIKAQQAAKFPTANERAGVAPGMAVTGSSFPGRATTAVETMNPAMRALSTVAEMINPGNVGPAFRAFVEATESPSKQVARVVRGEKPSTALDIIGAPIQQAIQAGQEIGEGDVATGVTRGAMLLSPVLRGPVKAAGKTAVKAAAAPIRATARAVTETIPDRLISSLIKPPNKTMKFGADPAKAVINEKFVAPTLGSLQKQIQERLTTIDAELMPKLAKVATKKDVTTLITAPIDAAIKAAKADGNMALANRLGKLRDGRIAKIQADFGTTDLTPVQRQMVKREIGKSMTWSEDVLEQSIDRAKQGIYAEIDKSIDADVAGAKALNERSAGLIGAEKSLEVQLDKLRKSNIVPTRNILELPMRLIEQIIPETLVKTTVARTLRKR
jgi:hypothetical protein